MEKITNLDASEKQRWRDIIELEIMSSDDSGDEDTIVSHSLPWLSAHVVTLKRKLDLEILKTKSPHARRQMKARMEGTASTQERPDTLPAWVLR